MSKQIDQFMEKLQELQKIYKDGLPAKLKEIHRQWSEVKNTNRIEDLKLLHRTIHSIAGSGATYGYNKLSEIARELEKRLKDRLEEGQCTEDACEGACSISADDMSIKNLVDLLETQINSDAQISEAGLINEDIVQLPKLDESINERLVFIVEDDIDISEQLALHLKYYGFAVYEFNSLDKVKQAVIDKQPAAIIVDVMFPEGDMAGINLVQDIKNSATYFPKIIFLSQRQDLDARLQAVRAGGDAYLSKPVDYFTLVDKLEILSTADKHAPFRIMIVDDDVDMASYTKLVLEQRAMETCVINSHEKLLETLADFRPELILMDLYMPGYDGIELAAVIRQQESYVGTPIVFLSVESDFDKHLSAMQIGGDDFLNKSISPNQLAAAVEARVRRARTINAFMVQDSLTGLLNHSRIEEHLQREFARAQRYGSSLTYVLLDLDYFKVVNDSFGHAAGDRVLRSLSRMLQQRFRDTDLVGRYGGEEFAIVLPNTSAKTAVKLINEVRDNFSVLEHQAKGESFCVTFSAGVAGYPEIDNLGQLRETADEALYQAKNAGRNRIVAL